MNASASAPGPLARLIAEIIRREGPISLERYWDLALFHREHGYYAQGQPFGAGGDFVTAPDVSQMFGELVAAWLVAAWRGLGSPSPVVLAEVGPGRGTLMADMLRTFGRIAPDFMKAVRIALVETSPRLQQVQSQRLEPFDLPIRHVARLSEVGPGPLLLVANELFDAVAIRQFVHTGTAWAERRIGLSTEGAFSFRDMPAAPGEPALPPGLPPAVPGSVIEVSPQRAAIAAAAAVRLKAEGGAALIFDYGHAASAYGDTLQALRGHAFADPLGDPGSRDITSHVDFALLADVFRQAGLLVAPVAEQGRLLVELGLLERAAALGRGKPADEQSAIVAAVNRLAGTGENEMGSLFKVLAAASAPLAVPPFAPPSAD